MAGSSHHKPDEQQFHQFIKLVLLCIVVISIPLSVILSQEQQSTINYAQGGQNRSYPVVTSAPDITATPTLQPTSMMPPTPTLYCFAAACPQPR